jgi:hypothetical protein
MMPRKPLFAYFFVGTTRIACRSGAIWARPAGIIESPQLDRQLALILAHAGLRSAN